MAMLCMDWVERNINAPPVVGATAMPQDVGEEADGTDELSQFDFVFFILLRHVSDNSSLEQIISKQHGLKRKIKDAEISSILTGEAGGKVLLLFDGYDEYAEGTNEDIDSAIEDTIGDCFVIVTSRDDNYIPKRLLNKFDGEVKINGFTSENVKKCASKYLESEPQADELLRRAEEAGIDDFLCVPIVLLMVCVLFEEKKDLPSSQSEIIAEIVNHCIDRSTMKHLKKKRTEIDNLDQMLDQLGELAWISLRKPVQQLLISKVSFWICCTQKPIQN